MCDTGTSQAMKWTWLQDAQALTCDDRKLRGPEQKMLILARQWASSKPWRNWRQRPTCRWEDTLEDSGSTTSKGGHEMGQNRPRPVCPGWAARPIFGSIHAPVWPNHLSDYLYPPSQEPRINSFFIRHWGAEKRGTPFERGEGLASCLGFP
jgi:hypothetical protein